MMRFFYLILVAAIFPLLEIPLAWALDLRVFGDVTFSRASSANGTLEENGSFALGALDLFMTDLIRDRIKITSELVIEQDLEGDPFIDLERLQVGYIFNDLLTIEIGRFHNALGYWSPTFIHGTIFQTSIERPNFLEFEHNGGILPIHLVGASASGIVTLPPGEIEYIFLAGNGSSIEPGTHHPFVLEPENTTDPNKNKSVSANLSFRPQRLSGLSLGIFSNHSRVQGFDGFDLTIMEVSQQILGGYLVYSGKGTLHKGVEFLGEYFQIFNDDVLMNTGDFNNSAYYIQLGYHVTERFIPYGRIEQVWIERGDPYFTLLGTVDSNRWLAGLRFSQNPNSALKAEIQWIDEEALDRYVRYVFQWAFGF